MGPKEEMVIKGLEATPQTVVGDAEAWVDACVRSVHAAATREFLDDATRVVPRGLCVLQGEKALLKPSAVRKAVDKAKESGLEAWVGSQDATTCVVVGLWCPLTKACFVAHMDTQTDADAASLLEAVEEMERPTLALVGGIFAMGVKSAARVLRTLHSETTKHVELAVCVVGAANLDTAVDADVGGRIRTRALALRLSDFHPAPAVFSDRGPHLARRFARSLIHVESAADDDAEHDGTLSSAVDEDGCVVLPAVSVALSAMEKRRLRTMRDLASRDTAAYLQFFSTTPKHESEWFVGDMIAMFDFCLANDGKDLPLERVDVFAAAPAKA